MTTAHCPRCRMRLRVALELRGRKVLCPFCRTGLRLTRKWLARMRYRSVN